MGKAVGLVGTWYENGKKSHTSADPSFMVSKKQLQGPFFEQILLCKLKTIKMSIQGNL